ncbi:MAG: hypothetical protein SGI83_15860 [Bacteroidota bacterium]|nr:hypothetical protein [Bacteroidota bacterium]
MEKHFFYCSEEMRKIGNKYGVFFSPHFCNYFNTNLKEIFYNATGLKASSKVTIGGFKQHNEVPMYQPGQVSRLNIVLWIMPQYTDNLSFCWKSKSGKIIQTTDEDFDESDLECWVEGIKAVEYWKEAATEKKSYPFQVKNLPYPVKVLGFGVHMGLTITLSNVANASTIILQLAEEIEKYNNKSGKKDGKDGYVHNSSASVEENKIDFRIDVGSASLDIIKNLLKALAKFSEVEEVVVDL